jgi:hypothetical protein
MSGMSLDGIHNQQGGAAKSLVSIIHCWDQSVKQVLRLVVFPDSTLGIPPTGKPPLLAVKKSHRPQVGGLFTFTCIRANNRIQFEVALRRAGFQGTPNATPVATPSELLPNRKFRFIPRVSKQTLGWN